jgi:hypothetical protein
MVNHDETRTALVVMEAGARWPSFTRELSGRASSAIVESQPPSEGLDEFSYRVLARIRRLEERGTFIPVALLAVSPRTDAEATAARYRMARAIVTALGAYGTGELVIVAEEFVNEDQRHELIAFAGALCDSLNGSDINVRVRFGAGESGLRPLAGAREQLDSLSSLRDSWA